jgi:putative transposase
VHRVKIRQHFYGLRRVISTLYFEQVTDNGSCYTASKTRSFAGELGLQPVTTWIRSPQSNEMAESSVRTFKGDYADLAHRPDTQTVMR